MSPVSWIVALSVMVGTVRAQELGGDEHPPTPSPMLDELRRLRARVDALENARSVDDAPSPPRSIDLSGEELTSIQSPAGDHVLSRPWFENVDISGYAAFTYLDTGGEGTSPDGSFLVKEASLFVDAQIWDRVFLHDETWIVRFPNSDQFMVGELYANMRNVFDAEDGDGLGLKVGRFELPFGEDYLRWDANETRWISFTAADPYGIDEGIELYGALGGTHWIAAITNGSGGGNGSDDGPAKLGALKLYGNPGQDLYTSLSLLTTGNSTRTALRLSGTPLTPVGAGGAASALGASPSEQVNTNCWEVDARIAESRRANLGLQFGQAFIDDEVSAFDRDLLWFTIEPCFRLTDDVELLLRYSEIGTDDAEEGYSFSGKPIAQGEDFGFDTHRLRRLSGGACWTVNPHVTGKLEIGHDWLDLIDSSTLDAQDDERLYFGVELVVSFDMHCARRLHWLPLAVAALLFTIAVGAQSPPGETPPPRSSLSLMNDVSQHFQRLETRLATGDLEGASKIATELGALREHLAKTRPQINAPFGDDFERHVARFGDIVDETARLASESRLADAAAAFEDLRAACVSCHVKFRANNGERGHYPARLNTIAGSVVLRDADDRVRPDRSWVLAFLESADASLPPVHVRQNPRVSQSGRRFHPRVLPVVVGTRVEFPNDDTIFHNVFSLSKTAPFDLGVYEPGHSSSVRMERTGLIKVYCNIHPEMTASIVVLANPWYALTDSTGQFVICGVPDGEYVLRAWNDMGAETRAPIRVGGNTVLPVDVELRETRRAVTHTNKYGKPYSDKYP